MAEQDHRWLWLQCHRTTSEPWGLVHTFKELHKRSIRGWFCACNLFRLVWYIGVTEILKKKSELNVKACSVSRHEDLMPLDKELEANFTISNLAIKMQAGRNKALKWSRAELVLFRDRISQKMWVYLLQTPSQLFVNGHTKPVTLISALRAFISPNSPGKILEIKHCLCTWGVMTEIYSAVFSLGGEWDCISGLTVSHQQISNEGDYISFP